MLPCLTPPTPHLAGQSPAPIASPPPSLLPCLIGQSPSPQPIPPLHLVGQCTCQVAARLLQLHRHQLHRAHTAFERADHVGLVPGCELSVEIMKSSSSQPEARAFWLRGCMFLPKRVLWLKLGFSYFPHTHIHTDEDTPLAPECSSRPPQAKPNHVAQVLRLSRPADGGTGGTRMCVCAGGMMGGFHTLHPAGGPLRGQPLPSPSPFPHPVALT